MKKIVLITLSILLFIISIFYLIKDFTVTRFLLSSSLLLISIGNLVNYRNK